MGRTAKRKPCQIVAGAAAAILRSETVPGLPGPLIIVLVIEFNLDVGGTCKRHQLGKEQQEK